MKRHVHRWTPYGEPVRGWQCDCGKFRKTLTPPPNPKDVAARRKIANDARKRREDI